MPQMTNPAIESLMEQVAAAKKQLLEERKKLLAEPVQDYEFKRPDGTSVRLSELFGDRSDLIVVHNMGRKCPYCTLWADGLNGHSRHLQSRAGFALCSPDEPIILKEFSESRGWNFPCISSYGSTFADDMGFMVDNDYWPGYSTFSKSADGKIFRHASDVFGPGDDYCAVWPVFDLLRDGQNDWEPKYTY